MKKADITKTIIELTVDKVLADMATESERPIRNLVDLGKSFSKGQFQKKFFEMAQNILENEESPYYVYVKNSVDKVNHETLKTFGINLGYNAYTYGVNQIRENEKKYCFIIPWTLIFSMENPSKVSENDVEMMISQGVKLGIYTYFIFCTTNQIKQVAHLLEAFEDCVFVIFLEGASIKTGELEVLYTYHNFMISIASESRACIKIMAFLRKRGFLYAMHAFYNDCKAEEIITGKWLKSPLRTATTFAFLISESTCSLKTKNEVRNYVINGREKQHYPLFLIDITSDISYINEVISEDSHFIGFNSEGQLYTAAGVIAGKNNNLRTGTLQEILKQNRSIKE